MEPTESQRHIDEAVRLVNKVAETPVGADAVIAAAQVHALLAIAELLKR